MVEALVHAVGNGAVVEKGSEHFLGGADDVLDTPDVQEGFLLTGEGRVRQVFGGGRRTHGNRHVRVTGRQAGERGADLGVETLRELGFHDPLTDLRAGLGQGVDVIDVQRIERGVDLVVQTT
ncbi:hypothetical protein D3C72_1931890 [compost metagenome]